jgi:hypothetical protein
LIPDGLEGDESLHDIRIRYRVDDVVDEVSDLVSESASGSLPVLFSKELIYLDEWAVLGLAALVAGSE